MYVVTLVHGTWGRGIFFLSEQASWTRDSSSLCTALRQRLVAGVELRRFAWSGGNSHAARSQAADQLRDFLHDGLMRWPNATHYVIAHSHGGNVTLSALTDSVLAERVTGVICLATPFLSAQERDLGRRPLEHLVGALVVVMLLTMWLSDRVLLPDSWPGPIRFSATIGVTSIVMGLIASFVKKWREFVGRLKRELALPFVPPAQLLIVRSPADEASAVLVFSQFISQLTVRVYMKAQTAYEWYVALMSRWATQKGRMVGLSITAFVAFIGLIVVSVYLGPEDGGLSSTQIVALSGALGSLYLSLVALCLLLGWTEVTTVFFRIATAAVVWPVIGLLSGFLLPFGREVAMANILLNVTAEPTPPGSWTVHLMEPPTSQELDASEVPLMHSVIYENSRALNLISEWILQRG